MDLLALMAFSLICFDVAYIKLILPYKELLFKLDLIVVCGLIVSKWILQKKLKIPMPTFILLAYGIYICMQTILNNGSLNSCIRTFSTPIAMSLVLFLSKNQKQLERILKIWCCGLFVLMCIDLFTMIIYPSGLYISANYTDNWFLGYKNNRLSFTFPLITICFFLDLAEKKCVTKKSIFIVVLALIDILRSNSTSGTLIIIIFIILNYYLIKNSKAQHNFLSKTVINLLEIFPLFLITYLIAFIIIIIMPKTPFVQILLTKYLNKSADFSGRVNIWNRSLNVISKSPLGGKGILLSNDYFRITGGFYNPHNTVLTYLLMGGFIGLFMLACFMFFVVKSAKSNMNKMVIVLYIYCVLWLGLISSILALSPLFIVLSILPLCYDSRNNNIRNTENINNVKI